MHGIVAKFLPVLISFLLACAAMADFDRTLDIALLHAFRRRPALRYPWETNPMVAHALGLQAPRPSFVFPLPVNSSVPPLRTERQALEQMVHALPTYRVKRRRILVEASQLAADSDDKRSWR